MYCRLLSIKVGLYTLFPARNIILHIVLALKGFGAYQTWPGIEPHPQMGSCTFPQLHSVTLIPALYILYTTIFSPFPHFICQSADMETINGGGEDDNETLDESNVPRVVCLSVSLSPPYSFCCLWSAAGPAKSLISVSYCTHNSPTATALRLTFNPPGLVRTF